MAPAIVFYFVIGVVIGCMVTALVFQELFDLSRELLPALGFLAGLVWPVTLAAIVAALLGAGLLAVARSFASLTAFLWDVVRPVRPVRLPEIPRATARRR